MPRVTAGIRNQPEKQGWSGLSRTGAKLGTRQDQGWSKSRNRVGTGAITVAGVCIEQPEISFAVRPKNWLPDFRNQSGQMIS